MKNKIKKPITRRFFIYIIVLIILSNILLFLSISVIVRNIMEKQVTESSINLLQRNLENVNEYLAGIDNVANSLIYNQDLIELVKRKENTLADVNLMSSIFSIFYQSRNDLKLIIYKESEPDKAYSIYSGSGLTETGDFHNSEWYRKISGSEQNRIMVSNHISAYTERENEEYVHVMIYKIKDRFSDTCIGYLRVDIDLQNLKKYFISEYENIDGTSIYDGDGNLLFLDKKTVKIPESQTGTEETEGTDVCLYQNSSQIIVYGNVSDIGWKMAFCVDKEKIYRDLNITSVVFVTILCSVILVTLLCSGRLFSIVTDNFKRLVAGMESVKQGNLETQVEVMQDDEVAVLIEEFNGTVRNLNKLMEEVEKKQHLLYEAEIKALQQQINPHFIFNILETIMGLASEGLDSKVITVCRGMSSMLRYNISFQSRTKLENEIVQMKNYIKIMQIRFENKFETFYDIDKSCLDAECVKFTLQPLVENSIGHGLNQCVSGGLLRIIIQRQEDMVAISIFDNGEGIEPDHLAEINRKIHETIENPLEYTEQYSGLGLMNVNLRLRMHFREQYHIEIFSKPGKGTCIYIKIPYIKIEE